MQSDCKAGRPDLDFGHGFYVTLLQDQAEGFARRKARDRKSKPVISVYEFDYDAAIQDCAYLKFEFYDEAWLDFVVASRNGQKPWAQYDVVEGGVANDRVIDTVELYTIGLLDKASALGKLSEHDYITLNIPPVALSIVPLQKRSLSVRQSYDYF